MAASRKGKPVANRPLITGTPTESATQTEVVRGLRLCYLRRWPNFKGYGFDLKEDEKGQRFLIDKVDIRSPAELGGLCKDDRLIEVNGTSLEGKTIHDVLELIKEDPVKVELLAIDEETEKEFAKRNEVPSRKSPHVVPKVAPSSMPITPRERKQGVVRKPPGVSSTNDQVIAIEELSSAHSSPVEYAEVSKPGKKGKPIKPAKSKAAAKPKAKGGAKVNAAEVSKAEAELLRKFVIARQAESADAGVDKGADDADRSESSEDSKHGRGHGHRGSDASASSVTAPSQPVLPYSPEALEYYGGAFVDDQGTDAAGYYWPAEQYPWAPPPSPVYAPPFSLTTSPPYAPSVFPTSPFDALSPMSGAGAYMPYALPGSPYWSPPMLPPMLPYQTPYMPLMPMPGFYGFPYAPATYPDFSPYSAPYPRYPTYPYAGGGANPYEGVTGEGVDASELQAGSAHHSHGSRKGAKKPKDKRTKSKDPPSSAPHQEDHNPDKGHDVERP